MFSNIGGKIKTLAVVVCVLGSIVSFVVGVAMLAVGAVNGLLIILVGVLCSWIGTFSLYGFGQLIEDASAIREMLRSNSIPQTVPDKEIQKPVVAIPADKQPAVAWRCTKCLGLNGNGVEKCVFCGKAKE